MKYPEEAHFLSTPGVPAPIPSPVSSSSKVLPASKTVADSISIPFGFLYSPLAPLTTPPSAVDRDLPRCPKCQGHYNKFSTPNLQLKTWSCVFCGANGLKLPEAQCDVTLPENNVETMDVTLSTDKASPQEVTKHVMFIVDDYIADCDKALLLKSCIQYIESAPDNTLVSLFLMSSVVNVFMLGQEGSVVQSEAFAGRSSMSQDLHKYLSFHARDFVAHLSTARGRVLDTLNTLYNASVVKSEVMAGPHCPFLKRKRGGLRRSLKVTPKCLGFALELALSLFSQEKAPNVIRHISVYTGGCPSYGPGAISNTTGELENIEPSRQYFSQLGISLAKARATVHLQCVGCDEFGVAAVEGLLENCGGNLIMQKELNDNMLKDLQCAIESIVGSDGVVRIQTSNNITLHQVVTSTVVPCSSSCYTKQYPVLSQYQQISSLFSLPDRITTAPVYLQCSTSYTCTITGEKIIRLTTLRYDCSVDHEDIVAAVSPNTSFALYVREHLQLVHTGEESSTKDMLTRQAHVLLTNVQTTVNDKIRVLLEELLEKLYYMEHGPMVSNMLQHRDDIDYLLHVLLRGSVEAVNDLVKARVYNIQLSASELVEVTEYPPLTMVFQSSRLLVLDALTDIYIWVGHHVKSRPDIEELLTKAREFVSQLAYPRFPHPRVSVVEDGTSMNRFVDCYLMPVHNDKKEDQLNLLPELSALPEQSYDVVLKKHRHIRSKTLYQWMGELRLVVRSSLAT